MIDWRNLFDSYSRQARLYPALLTLSPATLSAIALIPSLLIGGAASTLAGLAVMCGVAYLLADLARTAGKRLEPKLVGSWGGLPTTLYLRHSTDHLDSETKARRHLLLGLHVPGFVAPTSAEEAVDAAATDKRWASAVHWLREQCRGEEHKLVHRENANYGFRRNMLGLKPIGIIVAVLALAALVVFGYDPNPKAWHISLPGYVLATSKIGWFTAAICTLSLIGWWTVVTPSWVRHGADAYAHALLACCERLSKP